MSIREQGAIGINCADLNEKALCIQDCMAFQIYRHRCLFYAAPAKFAWEFSLQIMTCFIIQWKFST